MVNFRERRIKAREDFYIGKINMHVMNAETYFSNSVGVGEHTDIQESIDKEIGYIAEYNDKLEILKQYFGEKY